MIFPVQPWVLIAFVFTGYLTLQPSHGLMDDIFSFVSFEDVNEWFTTYSTCERNDYDKYREPRSGHTTTFTAPKESLSPVRIISKNALKSEEKATLHIYNNAGVRKGYSVSYGFQRNKECLHGEDANCVVTPSFGDVRAVVLNAERFKEGQNLNYIKDRFLIEEPEKFVTILNGGSIFERKFYEAVFLGGYPTEKDPSRSTHQIDGKQYPMEIYMYFVDETVPAMALTTMLVVSVEESDRDNPHIKPIVSTITNELYPKERQFLERNKALRRRTKLFHHLKESTGYDINDVERRTEQEGKHIIQATYGSSVRNEYLVNSFIEAFEKMESLTSWLYFLDEDKSKADEKEKDLKTRTEQFDELVGEEYWPMENPFLTDVLKHGVLVALKNRSESCDDTAFLKQTYALLNNPVELQLAIESCNYLKAYFELYDRVSNVTNMKNISYEKKYDLIKEFVDLRPTLDNLNTRLKAHYDSNYKNLGVQQNLPILYTPLTGAQNLVLDKKKLKDYQKVKTELETSIRKIRQQEDFPNDNTTMREVIHYFNFGYTYKEEKYTREFVSSGIKRHHLPSHQKMRGLVELRNMEMSEDEVHELSSSSPIKATVNQAFQVSWLIPPNGGYYYYKGSSPLPPCYRAQNVIVFKKPITMSRYQIEALTRIPVSFNKYRDIRSTHPRIHDLKFEAEISAKGSLHPRHEEVVVPVYFQNKSHLFLGHDGVHKNAVEESDTRKMKKSSAVRIVSFGLNVQGVAVLQLCLAVFVA